MKCAVLTQAEKLIIQDIPQPVPAAGEVLIEVETAALCGSDHSLYRGKLDGNLPLIPGHEAVGRIARLGEGTTGPLVGQRVVIQPNFSCRACGVCRSGMENMCPEKIRLGVDVNGVFAQYTVVPSHYVWPVPDSLENEVAIFTEPMAVAFHAIGKCSPEKGQRVLVFGAGVFGLMVTQLIALQGNDVVAFDLVKKRLDLAETLGARAGIQDLDALSDQGPFDIIFETSGAPVALSHSIDLAAPGGRIVLGGLPADPYPILSTRIVRKELRIFGTFDQLIRNPAAQQNTAGCCDVMQYRVETDFQPFHLTLGGQIGRKPSQKEHKRTVPGKLTNRCTENLTLPNQKPHDAHWIEEGLPGAGNILIYNNGWGRSPTSYSSVIEMDPETGEIVWEYGRTFFSSHISGCQRLPNGNTFVCSGNHGHLFEVTSEREVAWEFVVGTRNWSAPMSIGGPDDIPPDGPDGQGAPPPPPVVGNVFRAHRYGPDYPGLAGRALKPQGQIVEDVKGGWEPRVDLEGATQPGAKLWEKLWK